MSLSPCPYGYPSSEQGSTPHPKLDFEELELDLLPLSENEPALAVVYQQQPQASAQQCPSQRPADALFAPSRELVQADHPETDLPYYTTNGKEAVCKKCKKTFASTQGASSHAKKCWKVTSSSSSSSSSASTIAAASASPPTSHNRKRKRVSTLSLHAHDQYDPGLTQPSITQHVPSIPLSGHCVTLPTQSAPCGQYVPSLGEARDQLPRLDQCRERDPWRLRFYAIPGSLGDIDRISAQFCTDMSTVVVLREAVRLPYADHYALICPRPEEFDLSYEQAEVKLHVTLLHPSGMPLLVDAVYFVPSPILPAHIRAHGEDPSDPASPPADGSPLVGSTDSNHASEETRPEPSPQADDAREPNGQSDQLDEEDQQKESDDEMEKAEEVEGNNESDESNKKEKNESGERLESDEKDESDEKRAAHAKSDGEGDGRGADNEENEVCRLLMAKKRKRVNEASCVVPTSSNTLQDARSGTSSYSTGSGFDWEGALAVMKERERMLPDPKTDFTQEYINRRSVVLSWMVEVVANQLQLGPVTYHLAVALLDAVAARLDGYSPVTLKYLEAVAVACILIAAKVEEDKARVPSVSQLHQLCNESWPLRAISTGERLVLNTLDWNVRLPIAAHFLDVFEYLDAASPSGGDDVAGGTDPSHPKSSLRDVALHLVSPGERLCSYRPSVVAAAALATARRKLNLEPIWPDRLVTITGYDYEQVARCADELWQHEWMLSDSDSSTKPARDAAPPVLAAPSNIGVEAP